MLCPPPNHFLPAEHVEWAKILDAQPPFIKRARSRGAKARGVVYERKVHDYLHEAAAFSRDELVYTQSPWLAFQDISGRRWCQPDGILLRRADKHVAVVEVKYQHTSDAWWQLWRLYIPVLRLIYPEHTFTALEIVKWHDPHVHFPERYILIASPTDFPRRGTTAVHIWNPQRA